MNKNAKRNAKKGVNKGAKSGDSANDRGCVVVKLGSAMVSTAQGPNVEGINEWCRQLAEAMDRGERIVVVSSGAVAAGVVRMGMKERPADMNLLQASAAIGQLEVVNAYSTALKTHDLTAAMVLLTHADMANRERYLNARDTLISLLDMGVVPIVNENDSVATDEIRFGDNDALAAMVTNLLGARMLVLLTDQTGLHEKNPADHADAPLVKEAKASDPTLDAMAGGAGAAGRGGMISKLRAARLAARSGCDTVIARGTTRNVISRLLAGESLGTRLLADLEALDARKRWIADQQRSKGEFKLDDGASEALIARGVSLLPVGVLAVAGKFHRGDLVECTDKSGAVIAQGLANYDSEACKALLGRSGKSAEDISALVGFSVGPELIHRDNLVILAR